MRLIAAVISLGALLFAMQAPATAPSTRSTGPSDITILRREAPPGKSNVRPAFRHHDG
jgi:hypothetical protein